MNVCRVFHVVVCGGALAVLVVVIWGAQALRAEESPRARTYELYSWRSGNEWEYSLVPGTNASKAAVEIKRQGGPLRGSGKIKELLLKMREGQTISWQERAASGMVYPPMPVIEDLQDYAQTVGVKISVARRAPSKQ